METEAPGLLETSFAGLWCWFHVLWRWRWRWRWCWRADPDSGEHGGNPQRMRPNKASYEGACKNGTIPHLGEDISDAGVL